MVKFIHLFIPLLSFLIMSCEAGEDSEIKVGRADFMALQNQVNVLMDNKVKHTAELNNLNAVINELRADNKEVKQTVQRLEAKLENLKSQVVHEKQRSSKMETKLRKTQSELKYIGTFIKSYCKSQVEKSKQNTTSGESKSSDNELENRSLLDVTEHSSFNRLRLLGQNKPEIVNHAESFLPPRLVVRQSTESKVAFHVTGLDEDHRMGLGHYQTLKFKTVLTNIGNCYHHSTGVFVCNVPGVYVFYFNIITDTNVTAGVSIVKDGTTLNYAYVNTGYVTSGNMAITHVNAGDSVWVRVIRATGSRNFLHNENTFSGFLLYPD